MKFKVDKKDIKKWVKALRSGEYKQTNYTLQDKRGFCCLGVACKLFVPEDKQALSPGTGELYGDTPTEQVFAPRWLKDISVDMLHKTGERLVTLNDGATVSRSSYCGVPSLTFDEIADVLEAVYIHEVLK